MNGEAIDLQWPLLLYSIRVYPTLSGNYYYIITCSMSLYSVLISYQSMAITIWGFLLFWWSTWSRTLCERFKQTKICAKLTQLMSHLPVSQCWFCPNHISECATVSTDTQHNTSFLSNINRRVDYFFFFSIDHIHIPYHNTTPLSVHIDKRDDNEKTTSSFTFHFLCG